MSLAPRHYDYIVEITLVEYDGHIEFYRKLYEILEVNNPLLAGEKFAEFNRKVDDEQYEIIASQIMQLASSGAIIIVMDEGGVYQGSGDYQKHFTKILERISEFGRPIVFFVQTRMMREKLKSRYKKSAHIKLHSFSEKRTQDLMSLILKELDVDYSEDDIKSACQFAGGHPFNVHFIATYIYNEGIDVALSDPTEILEQNYEQGLDFLRRVSFNKLERQAVALLREYRFCDLEFVATALDDKKTDLTEAIRNLEDYCVIERRDRMLTIAPPLRDAVRRDGRFRQTEAWQREVGTRVIESLAEFKAEENIPLSLIDSAIPEMIRQKKNIGFLNNYILPSHLLRVARSYYDRGRWSDAVEFCHKSLDLENQLTRDARIEANRLLGLALARLNPDEGEISEVIKTLRQIATETARRVAFFIEGFQARKRGDYDQAEDCYRSASTIGPGNYHIARELSSVLCQTGRYAEAEPYARTAQRRAPDNPYILDVLIEAVEGKARLGVAIDVAELQDLYDSLREVCHSDGTDFYTVRLARKFFSSGENRVGSLNDLGELIKLTNDERKVSVLCLRADMYIQVSSFRQAREDIRVIASFGREAQRQADALEVRCLIAEGEYLGAKNLLDTRFRKAQRMAINLKQQLSQAILARPHGVNKRLLDWAKSYK